MRDYSLESILDLTHDRKPDFNNLLAVLNKKKPSRPTLFEFYLNGPLERRLAQWNGPATEEGYYQCSIQAFANAGYDYTPVHASGFALKRESIQRKETQSANDGAVIFDRESFEEYKWENPVDYYDGRLEKYKKYLPDGMKFIVRGQGGILENVIDLIGFNNLCYMIIDEPELVGMVADNVGQRFYEHYKTIIDNDSVGAIISNDDWGFNTQTMLSPDDLRKYIFPWHKKIADLAHSAGKPAILHSCGNLDRVLVDITDDIKYDGKHSYEDNIKPVEEMYDELKGKVAVLGGIDVDFMCSKTQDEIYDRCVRILEKTKCEGYALGTGNSVPEYIPDENYFAMISAALKY